MDGQMSLFDYVTPDYQGTKDEIVRLDIEMKFTRNIALHQCCGRIPKEFFVSCHNYYVECPVCKCRTAGFRHLYEAKQAWNRGERNGRSN